MTARKLPHERLKPGRKPKVAVATADAAPLSLSSDDSEPAQPVADAPPARVAPRWDDPLQRNRSPDLMGEKELREYGLQIGLTRRDASELSVDRLRTACKHRVYALIEEI